MNGEGSEAFENQVAELVGTAKGLLKEFEDRIGESISAQRVAASEARAEGARVIQLLQEISSRVGTFVEQHQRVIQQIEKGWQLRIDENAKRAGESQARAFGEEIAAGLRSSLGGLAAQIHGTARRFSWAYCIQWGLGIALGIPLTVLVCLWLFMPRAEGLSPLQVRAAATNLIPCQVDDHAHVCFAIDDKPLVAKSADGTPLAVVRGM